MKTFRRVLVANRGEIAIRIMRSLRELGIESIAIYDEQDRNCLHRRFADYSYYLGNAPLADTYLNIEKLNSIINEAEADGVHPGYGFLSENSDFAAMVEKSRATLIGPTADNMNLMGDKIHAKKFMKEQGLLVVPGGESAVEDCDAAHRLVEEIGLPVIIKASHGGGGRGMRVVSELSELKPSYEACRREAQSYFGNDEVFIERYIQKPRHIELQIICDQHGNGVHLFERDCSIQRRHQKLFEEAPSHYLSAEQRNRLGALAAKAVAASGYQGAGTIEFICESPDKVYFMEVNTRVQVEHPVSEMITGVDIVKEQILIAQGHPLSIKQEEIHLHGWSMEARINAEDPRNNFAPSPGNIARCHFPNQPFVRIDSHIYAGYKIPTSFDSLLAKVITWGRTREECMSKMKNALLELQISGIKHNRCFHLALLENGNFRSGDFTTDFCAQLPDDFYDLEKHEENIAKTPIVGAALVGYLTNHPDFATMSS